MEPADVADAAFAMPLTSPSFPRGPYRYINREYLIITYRTDPAELEGGGAGAAQVRRVEAAGALRIHADGESTSRLRRLLRRRGKHSRSRSKAAKAAYTHNMYLDAYAPISGGRELWGFPQKLASRNWRSKRDTLVGTLDYGPVRVARGTMGYKHRAREHDAVLAVFNEPSFLLKIIPHVDGAPRICELVR